MPKVIDLPTATSMDLTDYLLMEESTGGTKKITKQNALDDRAYTGYLTASNYQSILLAQPGTRCGVYWAEGDVTSIFSRGDATSSSFIVMKKTSQTSYDFLSATAASGRPIYVGRIENLGTSTQTVSSCYKIVGTGV